MKYRTQLKHIEIKGFKSISTANPICLDLTDVNIFLGANGSGKSNIIDFFNMLSYMMSGSFQRFIEQSGNSQSFLYYGSKITQQISAELRFGNKDNEDIYKFTLSYATPDRLIITEEDLEWQRKGTDKPPKKISIVTNYNESGLIQKNNNDETVRIIYKMLSNCKTYKFHDSSNTAAMRNSSPIAANDYLQAEANNIAAFMYRIKNQYHNSYNNIISYVRMIIPQFNDFILEPNNYGNIMLKWRDNSPNDYIFLPQQFSDGSMRFIALATLLLQPKEIIPDVIIIDEPELGLHPDALIQLSEMIKEASKNTQIIVATQSPNLVDEFDANNIFVAERDNENNCTTINHLNDKDLKLWLENYSISELWDKNIIGGRPL